MPINIAGPTGHRHMALYAIHEHSWAQAFATCFQHVYVQLAEINNLYNSSA